MAPRWVDASGQSRYSDRAANPARRSFVYMSRNNPVNAALVEIKERWPWSSARREADDKKRSSAPRLALHEM
jgi:hypothetical protein